MLLYIGRRCKTSNILEVKMKRCTVRDIAKLAGCSPYVVRKLERTGYLRCRRNYNNWRVFMDPEGTAKSIRKLLGESVATDDK